MAARLAAQAFQRQFKFIASSKGIFDMFKSLSHLHVSVGLLLGMPGYAIASASEGVLAENPYGLSALWAQGDVLIDKRDRVKLLIRKISVNLKKASIQRLFAIFSITDLFNYWHVSKPMHRVFRLSVPSKM